MKAIRPLLGPAGCCRFRPTCTAFAQDQLTTQPIMIAIKQIALRLIMCQPFSRGQ